jgi:uncharacterized phage protein (TIGR02218 family)
MKAASVDLANLLQSGGPYAYCELYTFTLLDSTVLRTCDADIDITWGGNLFYAARPICERTQLRSSVGIEVDSMTVTAYPDGDDLIAGSPFVQGARLGVLDGCSIRVERAYISTWPTVVGTIEKFTGNISDLDVSRNAVEMTVKSELERLAVQMPRNLFQSVCSRTLYDTGCNVNRSSFTVTGSVLGSPAPSRSGFTSALAQAAGYFDQGVLAITSGPMDGVRRTVGTFASGAFTFPLQLPAIPSAGTTFSVYPGCDKAAATCSGKFSNLGRYRGFPYIPTPETLLG